MCSDDANSDIETAKMESFFAARGYSNDLVRRRRGRASTNSRAEILKSDAPNNNANDNVPFVTPVTLLPGKSFQEISGSFVRIARQEISSINHH